MTFFPITGSSIVSSLGVGLEETWNALREGRTGIRPFERFHQDVYTAKVAGEIPSAVYTKLGVDPNDIPAQHLAEFVGRNVLEQTGINREKTGLVLATTKAEVGQLEKFVVTGVEPARKTWLPMELAREIAQTLGLKGPALVVSTACTSGMTAMIQACRVLRRGGADHMLVVGVDVLSDFVLSGFSSLAALDEGPCRPFDEERTGTSLGEGAGAILISQPETNLEPLACLYGWGASNDANHITGPSRTGDGLQFAIDQALTLAGWSPEEIAFVNAHGTGTVYNDEMEAKAIGSIFGKRIPPVASLKGFIGHTLGAAGTIETALCIEALNRQEIFRSAGYTTHGVSVSLPIVTAHRTVPGMKKILALKSGFGGTNAALCIGAAK